MYIIKVKKDKQNNLRKNVVIDYLYKGLMSIDINAAIWVLYLGFKGMTLTEIGLLEGIYHITSLISEIPTGAMADILGRKRTIVIGRVLAVMTAVLMLFSNSFLGFALSFIVQAWSNNLNSGSEEALIYDSLKKLGEEESYLKVNGNLTFVTEIGQGLAVLLGGILADMSFTYSYSLAIFVSIITFIVSLQFIEVKIHKDSVERVTVKSHFKECFRVMKENKKIIIMMMFFESIYMVGTTTHFYSQQHFLNLGYNKTAIAVIFVLVSIVSAVGEKFVYKIESLLKKRMLYIFPISASIILLTFSINPSFGAIVEFILFSFAINILYPVSSDYINKLIPSEQRATLISVESICFSIFMIIIFPIMGFVGDVFSLKIVFIVLSVWLFVVSIIGKHLVRN